MEWKVKVSKDYSVSPSPSPFPLDFGFGLRGPDIRPGVDNRHLIIGLRR